MMNLCICVSDCPTIFLFSMLCVRRERKKRKKAQLLVLKIWSAQARRRRGPCKPVSRLASFTVDRDSTSSRWGRGWSLTPQRVAFFVEHPARFSVCTGCVAVSRTHTSLPLAFPSHRDVETEQLCLSADLEAATPSI